MAITSAVTASATLSMTAPDGTDAGSKTITALLSAVANIAPSGAALRWVDKDRSVNSTGETLALTAMTQTLNSGGTDAVAFATIYAILIYNTATAAPANDLEIGAAAGTQFAGTGCLLKDTTDIAHCPSGNGILLWVNPAGVAITAGNDDLKIKAASGTATVSILIVGK